MPAARKANVDKKTLTARFRKLAMPVLTFCMTVTGVTGLILMISGFILTASGNQILKTWKPNWLEKYNKFIDKIPDVFPEDYHKKLAQDQPVFGIFFKRISVLFIVLGVFFTMTALFGCFINLKSKKIYVFLYLLLVIVITIGSIAALLTVEERVESNLRHGLESYSGLADKSDEGVFWNLLMLNLNCCGLVSFKDFQVLDNWPPSDLHNFEINSSHLVSYQSQLQETHQSLGVTDCSPLKNDSEIYQCNWANSALFTTPIACCRDPTYILTGCHTDNASTTNNWMSESCLSKMFDVVTSYTASNIVFVVVLFSMMAFIAVLVTLIFMGPSDKLPDRYFSLEFPNLEESCSTVVVNELIRKKEKNMENTREKSSHAPSVAQSRKGSPASLWSASDDHKGQESNMSIIINENC